MYEVVIYTAILISKDCRTSTPIDGGEEYPRSSYCIYNVQCTVQLQKLFIIRTTSILCHEIEHNSLFPVVFSIAFSSQEAVVSCY